MNCPSCTWFIGAAMTEYSCLLQHQQHAKHSNQKAGHYQNQTSTTAFEGVHWILRGWGTDSCCTRPTLNLKAAAIATARIHLAKAFEENGLILRLVPPMQVLFIQSLNDIQNPR